MSWPDMEIDGPMTEQGRQFGPTHALSSTHNAEQQD